eukprot:7674742-Pyramimonas_sp.AAC.1
MFLTHKADAVKEASLSQKCSKNRSCRPQEVLKTVCGGPIGKPGRFATARHLLGPHLGGPATAPAPSEGPPGPKTAKNLPS